VLSNPSLVEKKTSCSVSEISGITRSYRIVVGSSDKYIPVFLNWLKYYRRVCSNATESLYILCFDKASQGISAYFPRIRLFGNRRNICTALLEQHSLNCSYSIEYKGVNPKIWLLRAQVIKHILEEGHDVLLSDTDAIWLKNPFEDIRRYSEFDIISSRAAFPYEVTQRLGASLCMVPLVV